MFVSFYRNTTGVTSRAETVHPSGVPNPPPQILVGFVLVDL